MLPHLTEFLWALRRGGFSISSREAIDAARVAETVGFSDLTVLRDALSVVLCSRRELLPIFDRTFIDHFTTGRGHPGDLFDRLRGRGWTPEEQGALREILEGASHRSGQAGGEGGPMALLTVSPTELDWLLRGARIRRTRAGLRSPKTLGFVSESVQRELGVTKAASALARLTQQLREAFGKERGDELGLTLSEELRSLRRRIRSLLEGELEAAERPALSIDGRASLDRTFATLNPEDARDVRLAVRELGRKLGSLARRRTQRSGRRTIDHRAVLRASMRTDGVPIRRVFRSKRLDRPKLVIFCDVSDSVRQAAQFLLEFVQATHDVFSSVRSYVFVADLAETTQLFAESPAEALASIVSGRVVSLGASSSYGRVFEQASAKVGPSLDGKTTLVVLGDGRSPNRNPGIAAWTKLTSRARRTVWICPEGPSDWGMGDSAMPAYAEHATDVLFARTGRELLAVGRAIAKRT